MPDISMCANKECVKAKNCYRSTATPTEGRQYYMKFIPEVNVEEGFFCEYFWEVAG